VLVAAGPEPPDTPVASISVPPLMFMLPTLRAVPRVSVPLPDFMNAPPSAILPVPLIT